MAALPVYCGIPTLSPVCSVPFRLVSYCFKDSCYYLCVSCLFLLYYISMVGYLIHIMIVTTISSVGDERKGHFFFFIYCIFRDSLPCFPVFLLSFVNGHTYQHLTSYSYISPLPPDIRIGAYSCNCCRLIPET